MWRSCERWGILPPGIKKEYIENTNWSLAQLIGYEIIRNLESQE